MSGVVDIQALLVMETTDLNVIGNTTVCLYQIWPWPVLSNIFSAYSLLLLVIYSFIIRRTSACLSCCGRRPGVVTPMNVLEARRYLLPYIMAWIAIANFLYYNIKQTGEADFTDPDSTATLNAYPFLRTFIKILHMIVNGLAGYPLLMGLSHKSIVLTVMTLSYVWGYIVVIWYNYSILGICLMPRFGGILTQEYLRPLPSVIAFFYLGIFYIYYLVKLIKKRKVKYEGIVKGPTGFSLYVRALFLQKKWKSESEAQSMKQKLRTIVQKGKYQRLKGFHYPPLLLAVLLAALVIVYGMTIETVVMFTRFQAYFIALEQPFANISLQQSFDLVTGADFSDPNILINILPYGLKILIYAFDVFVKCLIVAYVVAFLSVMINIVHIILRYRSNMMDMMKGRYTSIPRPKNTNSPASLVRGFAVYLGYQAAYIFAGFSIHLFITFIFLYVFSFVIIIPLIYGFADFWVDLLKHYWPILLVSLVVSLSQRFIIQFCFTLDRGKSFGVNNRKAFFVFVFFSFFYNVLLGIISVIMRVVKGAVFGLVLIGRGDFALLPRSFERFDSVYYCYLGYLHMQNMHHNPVLRAFLEVITERPPVTIANGTANSEMSFEMNSKRKRAIMRWKLAYTLFWNPSLQHERKGWLEAKINRLKQFSENVADKSQKHIIKNVLQDGSQKQKEEGNSTTCL